MLLGFLDLKPAELYVQVKVWMFIRGICLWLVKEEKVLLREDTVKDALPSIPARFIFS